MVFSIRVSGLVLAGLVGSLRSHGTRDKAGSIIDRCYRERLVWKCSARFAHTVMERTWFARWTSTDS